MLVQSLEHLAQSALALAQSRRIVILGSSSILVSFPELGDAGFDNVFALEPLDLAVAKIVVGREKDLALIRGLLELGKISVEDLRKRWNSMPPGEQEMFQSGRNLALVVEGKGSR